MGIFGEKYSKEAYKDAEIERANARKVAESRGTVLSSELGDPRLPGWKSAQEIYDALNEHKARAVARVEKLYGKGQAEAIALNKKYDHLLTRAQEAVKAVEDFEREKLGMSFDEIKS